jgi:hypothetical protein
MALLNITAVGGAGTHTLQKTNVNLDEDFVYFPGRDSATTLSSQVTDESAWVFREGTGDLVGIDSDSVYFLNADDFSVGFSATAGGSNIDITNFAAGTVTFNFPNVYNQQFNLSQVKYEDQQAVKYVTDGDAITGLVSGNVYYVKNLLTGLGGSSTYNFTTHTFTTGGAEGRYGPTISQLRTEYEGAGATWASQYLSQGDYQGYQDWEVPVDGVYEFHVKGASGRVGRANAGLGAAVKGRVRLNRGEIITIAVGQVGELPPNNTTWPASSGGTFVVRKDGNIPLFVAGGGSSSSNTTSARNANGNGQTTNQGGRSQQYNSGFGVDGNGGAGRSTGGAGGGFYSNGGNSERGGGGQGFQSGLVGGYPAGSSSGGGGFGGGAGSDGQSWGGPGAAGGYAGGATNARVGSYYCGGGGSWIIATATDVATSTGTYNGSSQLLGRSIATIGYNDSNVDGSVEVTLVESSVYGFVLHQSPGDAAQDLNAIEVEPAGSSYHALIPLTVDVDSNQVHFTSPHGFFAGKAVNYFYEGTPVSTLNESSVYYIDVVDDYSFRISTTPDPDYTTVNLTAASSATSEGFNDVVVNLDTNSFTVPNHGFLANQPVRYRTDEQDPIVPLQDNATYYVKEVIDANRFTLSQSLDGPVLDLTALGEGRGHSFVFTVVNEFEDSIYIPSHGFVTGQTVQYAKSRDYEIQRLYSSGVYKYVDIDTDGGFDGNQFLLFDNVERPSERALFPQLEITSFRSSGTTRYITTSANHGLQNQMFVEVSGLPATSVAIDRRWNGFWRVTGTPSANEFSYTAEESFTQNATDGPEGAVMQRDLDYEYFLGERRVKIRGIQSSGRNRYIYCDRPHYHANGYLIKIEGIPDENYGGYFNGEWFKSADWNPGALGDISSEYGFYWTAGSSPIGEDENITFPYFQLPTDVYATVVGFGRIDNIETGINGARTRLRYRNDYASLTQAEELDVSGFVSKRGGYVESRRLDRRTRIYFNLDYNHDRIVGDRITVNSMEDRFRDVFNRQFYVSQVIDADELYAELDVPVSKEIESIRFGDATGNTGQYNDIYINFAEKHGWSDGGDAWFNMRDFTDQSDKLWSGECNIINRRSEGARRYITTDNPHRLSTNYRVRVFNFDDGDGNEAEFNGDWIVAGTSNATEFYYDVDTGNSLTTTNEAAGVVSGRIRRAYFLDDVFNTGITWRRRTGNVVRMYLDTNHGMEVGEWLRISNCTGSQPEEFNGEWQITAVPSAREVEWISPNTGTIAQQNIDGTVWASRQIRAFDEPQYTFAVAGREMLSHNIIQIETQFEHGFDSGMTVNISGMSGNNTGVFNGTFDVISAVDDTHFTLTRPTQTNVTQFNVTNRSRTSFLCDVTLNTTHNFQPGDTVVISNMTGTNIESFNGTHVITAVPATNRIQFVDPLGGDGTIAAASVTGVCQLERVPLAASSGTIRLNSYNSSGYNITSYADLVETSTDGYNGIMVTDTAIPGLNNRDTYYVQKVDDNTIRLSEDPSFTQIADIEGVGVGNHSIINKSVDYENDTITIPNHGFSLAELVEYDTGGGTAIGGLTTATPYYVIPVDGNTLQLATSVSNANNGVAIDLTTATTPTGNHTLKSLIRTPDGTYTISNVPSSTTFEVTANGSVPEIVKTFDPQFTVDLEQNVIKIPSHGFLTGTKVTYSPNGGTALGGLTADTVYYAIAVNKDFIKIADTAENAASGVPLHILTIGAGTEHLFTSAQINGQITGTGTVSTEVDSVLVNGSGTTFSKILKVGDVFRLFPPDIELKSYFEASDVDDSADEILAANHPFVTGESVLFNAGSGGRRVGIARIQSSGTTRYIYTSENHGYSVGNTVTISGLSSDDAEDFEGTYVLTYATGQEIRYTASESFTLGVENQDWGGVVDPEGPDGVAPAPLINDRYYYVRRIEDAAVRAITARYRTSNVVRITTSAAHNLQPGNVVTIDSITGVSPEVFNGTHTIIAVPSSTTFEFNSNGANIANAGVTGNVNNTSSNLVTLHPSYEDALANTNAIDLATQGSGSQLYLNHVTPSAPIIREIAAIGSDEQVTVSRPYTTAYENVSYSYPTFVYVRPQGYSLHRPFDGGVEMSTGADTWYGSIVRQTRKYFRYQSGKGIQTSAAVNFKPSIDIETMYRVGTSNVIQVRTRRPHGLINGLFIRIDDAKDQYGVDSPVYNGTFQVTVIDSFNLTVISQQPIVEPVVYGYPRLHVDAWTNGAIRSGMFDFQNGMFYEFDGQKIYAVRRSSTQQIAGTFACLQGSEKVFGTNTAFETQLDVGDYIVLRGQSYRIADIESNNRLTIKPEYKGASGTEREFDPTTVVSTATDTFTILSHGYTQDLPVVYNSIDGEPIGGLVNGRTYYVQVLTSNTFKLKASPDAAATVNLSSQGTTTVHSFTPAKTGIIGTLTVDTKIPQEDWSLDPCNGTGPTGYNLDLSKIQMIYMDYSWYGAGKIRFGFKTVEGQVKYVHEFTHNNQLFESYFRSGNLPARYEVTTFANPTYIPSLFHWGTSVIMDGEFDDDKAYLFTKSSQTLNIGGTTSKTFGSNALSNITDVINIPSHGFSDGDAVQFLGLGSNGLPQNNNQNPRTQYVGSYYPYDYLINETTYYIKTVDDNNIALAFTEADATRSEVPITSISKSNYLVTVDTNGSHGLQVNDYVLIRISPQYTNYLAYSGVVRVSQIVDANTFRYYQYSYQRSSSTISNPQNSFFQRNIINFYNSGNSQSTYKLSPQGSLNNTSGTNYQPLISIRLSPSVSEGLTGALGDRDVINRMQLRLQEVGVQTNELIDVKILLNGRLNNLNFIAVESPSLVQVVEHTSNDTISGGIQVYNFKASGNNSVEQTTNVDVSDLFELSNSILGGDSVFPDGPDILTVAVARLTGQETLASAKLSWGEAQA